MHAEPAQPTTSRKITRRDATWFDQFMQITSTGLFFMLIGCVFLVAAYATMGSAHATFSFILVVIGTAVLLYGTGTHGVGQAESYHDTLKYKIRIAGGAGAIAFCTAMGIAFFSEKMRQAFGVERKYFIVRITSKAEGLTRFEKYIPEFTMDGHRIPAITSEYAIEAYVPYVQREVGGKRKLSYTLYKVEPSTGNATLKNKYENKLEIKIGDFNKYDGGYDFPVYMHDSEISLESETSTQDVVNRVHQNDQTPPESRANIPSAIIPDFKDM